MTREMIFEIVKAKVLEVLVDLDAREVTPESNLTDLGANSVDRVEVSMGAMEQLGVRIPRVSLHGVQNLGGLVEVLFHHVSAQTGKA